MKKVIIVESPNKIAAIEKYFDDSYMICASNGQIMDLAKGGRFGIGVNPINKFKTYYHLIPEKIFFLDKIISSNDQIEKIIICTDPDTEGHGIAWHIFQNLKHLNKPIYRAEFHEITESGIKEGLSKITEVDINKFKAQETRRILDRIVGFMVSPFLINYYGDKLSAGRVQSVATKMVTSLERTIKEFKSEEYWNLGLNVNKETLKFKCKYFGEISNKKELDEIISDISKPTIKDSIFEITKLNKKEKKQAPPPPLTTAKIQQLMSSKYGIEGEDTMAAAQSLYELGFVTYIRTDSTRISDTALDNVRQCIADNSFDLPKKPNIFKNKEAAQNAHECIRPTNLKITPEDINLSDDIKKLYKLIWKFFIASQMSPAIYDTLEAKVTHTGSGRIFKISGKVLKSAGYLSFLEGKENSNKELPTISIKDLLSLDTSEPFFYEQKFTQPPSRFTYSSLIEELESNGIGRPSTYTEIVSKITNRHYVEKHDEHYYGTELGEKITSMLDKYFDFMKYDYTADLEKQMDNISLGKVDSLSILDNFYTSFKNKLSQAQSETGGKICEKCSSPMYFRVFDKSSFHQCALYPFCHNKIYENLAKAS